MRRRSVALTALAAILAILVEVGGWTSNAGAGEQAFPQDELLTQVYAQLSDAVNDLKANQYGKKVPCLPAAIMEIWESLDIPKHVPGECPWCGEKSPKAPTCAVCGMQRVSGWSQTGVGSTQSSLSYDISEKSASGKVSGVMTRKTSVNDVITSSISVDLTYKKECQLHNTPETCASFHAIVEGTVTYFESEDHKTVSDIKVSDVSLTFKSLFCCNEKPRTPYEVNFPSNAITPYIKHGDQVLQTPQPKPSPSPEAPPSAAPAQPSAKPINEDPKFKAAPAPQASPQSPPPGGSTEKTSMDYAPETTSLHDEVLVTARDPGTSMQGATEELVDEVDANNQHHPFSAMTDENGHLKFLPEIVGLSVPIVMINVFHRLPSGELSPGRTTVVTDNPQALPGSEHPASWKPGMGSAIERTTSVVDTHGSDTALLEYQTTGTNASSVVFANGSSSGVETVAASDQSVIALARGLHKGLNTFSIETGGKTTNTVSQAVVSAAFVPLPPLHANQIAQLTEKIDGVQGLKAILHLTVSGAATFADGTTEKWLPVVNGTVTQPIKAASHAGGLDIKSQLFVQTPSFSLPPTTGT
jgi:hypothetical protein